jgi:nucleotide-binding universal stress UspA family protein
MKKAVIALSPREDPEQDLGHFYETLRLFQDRGFFAETTIASVIHPFLYLMPNQWFKDMRGRLAKEAHEYLERSAKDRFRFQSIKILQASTDTLEALVTILSRFASRSGSDVLVTASNDRTGFPLWLLGSFSETAALTARHPILVIKPHMSPQDFAPSPHMVVCIDVTAPPSTQVLRWIAQAAGAGGAAIDLVYVKTKRRPILDVIQPSKAPKDPQKILDGIQAKLQKAGLQVSVSVLEEGSSLAQTLVDFAEQKQTWAILTVAAARSTLQKLMLGSNARRILTLTQRPFLSLRLG